MSATATIPVTLAERRNFGPGIVRFPASWEEYIELLADLEYRTEYDNNHIIATSIATDPHERMVANILGVLYNLLENQIELAALGSNRHVYLEELQADYAPDASVLKGKPIEFVLRKGLTAYTNPHIIFEVQSPSTRKRDWSEKLPRYKKIPSVQQIIYIEQARVYASVFNRMGNSSRWENVDYDELEQTFSIAEKEVHLKDFYRKMTFAEEGVSES